MPAKYGEWVLILARCMDELAKMLGGDGAGNGEELGVVLEKHRSEESTEPKWTPVAAEFLGARIIAGGDVILGWRRMSEPGSNEPAKILEMRIVADNTDVLCWFIGDPE